MADVKVRASKDGPFLVNGSVEIQDAEGKALRTSDDSGTVALCRCGSSKTKPFCDGSHKGAGFKG